MRRVNARGAAGPSRGGTGGGPAVPGGGGGGGGGGVGGPGGGGGGGQFSDDKFVDEEPIGDETQRPRAAIGGNEAPYDAWVDGAWTRDLLIGPDLNGRYGYTFTKDFPDELIPAYLSVQYDDLGEKWVAYAYAEVEGAEWTWEIVSAAIFPPLTDWVLVAGPAGTLELFSS
jgi:hypothetical protein